MVRSRKLSDDLPPQQNSGALAGRSKLRCVGLARPFVRNRRSWQGSSMQRCLLAVICGPMLVAQLGCTTSPVSPSSLSPPPPASPFANVVGNYALTIEIDEKCAEIPRPLRVREYDVVVEGNSSHYLPVRVVGDRFGDLGGELWAPGPDARFRFEWNNFDVLRCDYPEPTGSSQLYLCGDGTGTLAESTISGIIRGSAFLEGSRPEAYCTGASHRFTLVRESR